jgi:hypothetical protein
MNGELTFADGAGTTTRIVPTDDAGLIQRHMEISWRFSKAKAETLSPHWSIPINLEPGYNLPFVRIYNFSELSRVVFKQLRGIRIHAQQPDHGFGFGLTDPMPYGRMDEWVFSYDGRYVTGLWDSHGQSMEARHNGGQE